MPLSHQPDDHQRQLENQAIISRNNHKKAKDHPDIIQTQLQTDIDLGFCCVLEPWVVDKIPGAMVCPLGAVE
jgi:hypothetical protein